MLIGFTSTSFRQIKKIEKIVEIAVRAKIDCIEWGGDIHVKDIASAKKQKGFAIRQKLIFAPTAVITV